MKIALFLAPGFGLLAYANLHEILFLLTRDQDSEAMSWHTVGLDEHLVFSSSGRPLKPDRSMAESHQYDVVIVLSAVSNRPNKKIGAWLRDQARHGAIMGGVTSALWLLADAGLVGDRRCTIHWGDLEAFRKREAETVQARVG